MITNWSRFENFSKHEFDCSHTGENRMDIIFMRRLQKLRSEYGKSMVITSGYRHPTHPIEARKSQPGSHSSGRAADIRVKGKDALILITLALKHGFTGIGVQQKGGTRFIHLDDIPPGGRLYRPTIWSY